MNPEDAIQVEVRNNRMEAFLILQPGLDLELLDEETCKGVVRAEGVILTTKVDEAINEAIEAYVKDPSEKLEMCIAVGTPPVPGVDGSLDWMDGYDPTEFDSCGEPKTDEDGRVDFYSTSHFRMACKGDHIATVRAPTLGVDGTAVDDGVVLAQPGRSCSVRTDQSVSIHDDGTVVANQSGIIEYDGSCIRVLKVLEVPDYIDFSTGNITFDGSITVQKGIRDCFKVRCNDDLTVRGLVEAAHLEVGGNAVLSRGMAGREKGTFLVRGNMEARYLEGVSGQVLTDLEVEREIVNCLLIIGCSLRILNGSLIGGCTRVGQSIEVDVIGSGPGVPTTVSIGDIPKLIDCLEALKKILPAVEERRDAAAEELQQLSSAMGRLSPLDRERLTEAQFELSEWERRQTALLSKKEEIFAILDKKAKPSIIIQKFLHADSIIFVRGKGVKVLTALKGPVQIEINPHGDAVVVDMVSKEVSPLENFGDPIDMSFAFANAIASYGKQREAA